MSRQFRYRATGIALAALFAVAPLLTTGSAHAEQAGDREVVFGGGGVLGLSCAAQPNVETMRVRAGTTLRVVNRTGHRAKLRLNGDSQGQLADNGATEVVFRRGTVAVAMEPDCVLRDATTPVLVTASPSAAPPSSTPNPPLNNSTPPTSDSAAPPSSPTGTSSPVATSSSTGGSPSVPGSPAGSPSRPSGSGTATRQGSSTATSGATSMPQGGTTSRVSTGATTSGTTAATPTFAGMPPGDDSTIGSGVPSVDALPPTDLASASTSAAAAASAETVAALEPITGTGQDGLLAAIATICVLGVGAGAIRAFVAQRASGTRMA